MSNRARPRARTTLLLLFAAVVVLLPACSSSKGPDLAKQIDDLPALSRTTTPPEGVTADGADATWLSKGTEQEVAELISAKQRPDETSTSVEGGTFLLYRSGTVWLTPAGDQTAVVLYKDNERAYRSHSGVLLLHSGWGGRMRSYDSGGSSGSSGSSGNGFRGGGSGSGK